MLSRSSNSFPPLMSWDFLYGILSKYNRPGEILLTKFRDLCFPPVKHGEQIYASLLSFLKAICLEDEIVGLEGREGSLASVISVLNVIVAEPRLGIKLLGKGEFLMILPVHGFIRWRYISIIMKKGMLSSGCIGAVKIYSVYGNRWSDNEILCLS